MNFKHRSLLLILVLLLAMPFTIAQEDDKTVTVILTSDPRSLNPQTSPHPSHTPLFALIYDTLVYQEEGGAIVPYLAESWEISESGRDITFKLKPDIKFSNGNPVDADAVIYTFTRFQEVGQRSFIYGDIINIAEFEKIDDLTVIFHLRAPSATLFGALAYGFAGILDQETVEAAEEYGAEPVGSGPYMIAEWVPEDSITWVSNPYYNGQRPSDLADVESNVSEVVIRFTRDQTTRVNALLAGEVDAAYITSAPQLARIADNPDFTVLSDNGRSLQIAGFNSGRAPFDNAELRVAVAQAIDKQAIVDIAAPDGMAEVMDVFIPPSIFGYNEALNANSIAYDVDAAKEAVAASGFDGTIKILTSTTPGNDTVTTIIQAQLVEIGIDSEIEILDFSAVREVASSGDYDIIVTRYSWYDPDLLRIYLSTDTIGASNRYFFSNEGLDTLVAEGRSTFDVEARYDIYTQAQEIVMEEMPWVPLYMPVMKVVVSNRVENVDMLHGIVLIDDAVVK